MTRVQTNTPGVVGLQPQARPTDQFYSPEVRRGVGASDSLIGLAQGLSAIEPSLQRIVSIHAHRTQAGNKKDLADGSAFQTKAKIENKQALKDAVKRGEIRESDNPWFMIGLEQAVAGVESEKASRDLFDAYTRSNLQHSDNPQEIERFAAEHFAKLTENRTGYEMDVIGPRVNDATNRLVTFHIQNRAEERQKEMVTAETANLSAIVAKGGGAAAVSEWAASVSGHLSNSTINAIVQDTAEAAALAGDNPGIYLELMSGVGTTGGKTLADTAQNKLTQQRINAAFIERQAARSRAEEANRKQMVRMAGDALMGSVVKRLAEARKTNPNATFEDVGFTLDTVDEMQSDGALDHETGDYVRQAFIEYARQREHFEDRSYTLDQRERTAKDREKKDQQEIVESTINDEVAIRMSTGKPIPVRDALGLLVGAMKSGPQFAFQIGSQMDKLNSMVTENGDENAFREGLSLWHHGQLDVESVDRLAPRLNNRQLEDLITKSRTGRRSDGSSISPGTFLDKEQEDLGRRALHAARVAGKFDSDDAFKDAKEEYTAAVERAETATSTLFNSFTAWSMTPEGQNATDDQKIVKIQELSDTIAKSFGATAREKMIADALPKPKQAAAKPAVKPSESGMPSVAEAKAKGDPVLTYLDEDDFDTMRVAGATPAKLDTRGNLKTRGGLDYLNPWLFDNNDPLNRYLGSVDAQSMPGSKPGFGFGKGPDLSGNDPQRAWLDAMGMRLRLKQEVAKNQPKMRTLLDTLKTRREGGQFFITPEEKTSLILMADQVQRYALMTTNVGITVAEAKEQGAGAYMTLPMFASEADFVNKVNTVSTQLGLTPEEGQQFSDAQARLLKQRNDAAVRRNGRNPGYVRGLGW